jgi:hypothetical protein
MERRRLRQREPLRARDVPRAPRPVPWPVVVREHLFPFATGWSWMLIGAIALTVGRMEGLPPPERSTFGAGVAWLVGMSLVVGGLVVLSWGLVRSSWWSRLQRHGRAADATVTRVRPLPWVRIGGRRPLDVELSFEDAQGQLRDCRVRTRASWREEDVRVGESLVVIHSPGRPEEAVLYWKR